MHDRHDASVPCDTIPNQSQIRGAGRSCHKRPSLYLKGVLATMSDLLPFHRFHFLKSAPSLKACPKDTGIEIALMGRSNAGKSSALNTLTGIHGLAKTSKQPGHTRHINIFTLEDQPHRLMDLPGYGYAKVGQQQRDAMQQLLQDYLSQRHSFYGAFLFMDIRHPLTDSDWECVHCLIERGRALHVLLTKSDKLARSRANQAVLHVRDQLRPCGGAISVQSFSSLKGYGLEEARLVVTQWLSGEQGPRVTSRVLSDPEGSV